MKVLFKKLKIRWLKVTDKCFVKIRRRCIKNKDFSIICNNCWAGYVYRRYGISYLTPTVGLYFFAEDFIKLCYNLKYYMHLPLEFISVEESKYSNKLKEKGQVNVPIARLDDIEVIFLHYKTEQEAREKWERRVKRINYDNLIFKFSEMNDCSYEHLQKFDALEVDKKFVIVTKQYDKINCSIVDEKAKNQQQIKDDTTFYHKYINLNKLVNAKKVCGNRFKD
ncbi:MAG: DUF1919 domain-containing protein [Clostridia bacterium]|nr:DUF1919 domain-containing protein [Clostridia bacterium]